MDLDLAAIEQQEVTGPKFTIVTKALSGVPTEDGRRRFKATASSTIADLKGDEIQLSALQQMAEQFRQGVGIFMDHDRSTGSAFGVTDGAEIVQRGMDAKTGKPIWDLDITGVVNTPNPRAAQLIDSIDGGYVKLGASVTAFVRKHLRNQAGGMTISDVDVIEASVVGVPENQRSWVQKAIVAVKSFYANGEGSMDEPIVDQAEAVDLSGTVAGPANVVVGEAGPEAVQVIEKGIDPEPVAVPANAAHHNEDEGDRAEVRNDLDTAAAAGDSDADAAPAAPSSDVQESVPETPETASSEASEGGADPLTEKAYTPDEVRELVQHTGRLVAYIGDLEAQIIEKDAKIASYEAQAGSIAQEVDDAKQVIEKVLAMPLRSRTAGYVEELARPGSLFADVAPGIAEYLNKRSKIRNAE